MDINGTVAPGFEPVRDELGTIATADIQVAAYRHGQQVVDLWTGADLTGDALLGAYSASKGAAHLVVALLVQRGVLDLDQRVSHYWPEFGVHGKQDLLLRDLLAHRAGLVGADEGFTLDELADDQIIAERLAAQRPYWRPGAAFGYHALVIAALTGEVVRRATGSSIQDLFDRLIREPSAVDFYLGLPADREPRFLTTLLTTELPTPPTAPNSLSGIAFNRNNPTGPAVWELPNLPIIRSKGPASVGGIASARGLARLYAAAISPLDGAAPLLSPDTIGAFGQIQSIGYDPVTLSQKAFTPGFHATAEYYPSLGQGAFGHSGAGGQQAFADPRNGIAFGYTRRQFPVPAGPGEDVDRLINALYGCARVAADEHRHQHRQGQRHRIR